MVEPSRDSRNLPLKVAFGTKGLFCSGKFVEMPVSSPRVRTNNPFADTHSPLTKWPPGGSEGRRCLGAR